MTTLSTINPTLVDVAKRLDPNGNIDKIVELLNQDNQIIDDATFIEGNLPTGHRTTVRTGIPTPTWRKLYGGVQPTKSTTSQITDNIGTMHQYAEVDVELAELNGNTAAWRMSEERAFLEGFNQEFAGTLLYGNESTAPAEFTGLAPRFNSLSAGNASNIVSAGGSDNAGQTSIWVMVWGPNTVHCIYPKGSKAGLSMEDKGQITIEDVDGNGGRMEAFRTHYKWSCGLSVRDWRYIVRVANVDVSDLAARSGTQAASASTNLVTSLIKAVERIPSFGMGRAAIYCNRATREALRLLILDKVSSQLTYETVAGKRVMSFDGIPVRRVDQITNTENPVT